MREKRWREERKANYDNEILRTVTDTSRRIVEQFVGFDMKLTWEISSGQHRREDGSLQMKWVFTRSFKEGLSLFYLQLAPGIEFLQAVDSLLSMYNRCNAFSLLWKEKNLSNYSVNEYYELTQIHGCFNASDAVMRLYGLTVSIWLIKFFASGVTVSHSGDGYCEQRNLKIRLLVKN